MSIFTFSFCECLCRNRPRTFSQFQFMCVCAFLRYFSVAEFDYQNRQNQLTVNVCLWSEHSCVKWNINHCSPPYIVAVLLLGAASAVAWKRVFLSSALTKIRHPHSFSPQSDNFARGLGVTVTDSCLFNQRTQFATMSVVMFQSAVSVGL